MVAIVLRYNFFLAFDEQSVEEPFVSFSVLTPLFCNVARVPLYLLGAPNADKPS